ncbi:MAG: M20/M25/M40 family metallo-hydrolase, partial [Alistipes sp.]|nr:M20/M25/M40 family metallo-hydrolase [Alistipes sp.]
RHLLKDPIAATAQLITALLALNTPDETLSIGKVMANGATNVVPDEVAVEGTLRTFNEQKRQALHRQIEAIATDIDQQAGTTTHVDISHGYPSVVNDGALVERLAALAALRQIEVLRIERMMTAEDFGFYTRRYPSLFYRLGVGAASGRSHTAAYAPSEEAIPIGIDLLMSITHDIMQR